MTMNAGDHPPASDDQLLEDELAFILEVIHRGNPRFMPRTFSQFIGIWICGVEDVERGYELEIESYTRVLVNRTSLERIRDRAPQSLSARLAEALPPLDARFDAATWAIDQSLVNQNRSPEDKARY